MLVCPPWESRPDAHGTSLLVGGATTSTVHRTASAHRGATFAFRVTCVTLSGSG